MSSPPTPINAAQSAVQQAQNQLQGIDPSPFSQSAFTMLKAMVGEYVTTLVSESVKVSRRHRADTVSAAHVERASEYLVTTTSRKMYRHLGTIGGVLLGAALSNLLAMSLAGQYTGGGAILSAALGIVGSFLVALHIAKD